MDGALGLRAGLTVLLLAPELYGPLRQAGQQFHAAADGTAAAERIFAVLDRQPALAAVGDRFELSGRWGAARVMSGLRARLARKLLLDGAGAAADRSGELAAAAVQGVDALEAYFAGYLSQLALAALVPLAVLGWVLALDFLVFLGFGLACGFASRSAGTPVAD